MLCSVIICTHNPRQDILERCLQALRQQTLTTQSWELLLIDNASSLPVEDSHPVSWHPNGRIIKEAALGLTNARLRGFKEATSSLLIMVDDDNLLEPDYLQHAVQIAKDMPFLGAWGGQQIAEFEQPMPPSLSGWAWMLALSEFTEDRWANYRVGNQSIPVGAGMCVRTEVAVEYQRLADQNAALLKMDRVGTSLLSCGDIALALTACDMGQAIGRFARLKLTHIITAQRTTPAYLRRLSESGSFSMTLLRRFRGEPVSERSLGARLRDLIMLKHMPMKAWPLLFAAWRGADAAMKYPLQKN